MKVRSTLAAAVPVVAVAATSALTVVALAGPGGAAGRDDKTAVSIWRAPSDWASYAVGYGGTGYGGDAAFVSHHRTVDIPATGEVRFPGVSARIEPSTVQVRGLGDGGVAVLEQRFDFDLATPDLLLQRNLGREIVVRSSRGEVRGTLRAVSGDALVLEVGAGAERAVEIVQRGGLDVQLPVGDGELATEPTLSWKLAARKAGKQPLEVSYRTAGLRWEAAYTAVLDDAKGTLDLSAWATITNESGVALPGAQLELVTGVLDATPVTSMYAGAGGPARSARLPPSAFQVARAVDLPARGAVQLELMPARAGLASKRVVVYQATVDTSSQFQAYVNTDCYGYGAPSGAGSGEAMLELEAPGRGAVLPEGSVRVFRRKGDVLELLGEDRLRVNAQTGHARLRLGADEAITGERKQVDCKFDDRTRTIREKIEVTVENKSREATEVVLREYMARWVNWKIEAEDLPGSRSAPQTQEYRLRLAPGARRSFTYTTLYSW